MTWEETGEKLQDLPGFIQYLIDTREDEWAVDVVRTKGGEKNCLFGHLVNWVYGKDYEGSVTRAWDIFEEMWSSTWEIYPINDGQDPRYKQATPKQRCIAFMKDLWLAQAVPTWRAMEIDEAAAKERMAASGQT